ncbi:putative Polycomb group protein ASXL1 [Synchiropus splendidus]|uniref:putative Polycomb group protein ASXL1 n=1 Tax=Synchiropus splendidus TaxID=270530 RepID=UPI00237E2D69|nr:putative Polycomb group protein ASXL1 [Synchiropus splendidus]
MKDKQKRKKERTWAEAARMVLENFSDAPMTPKQILHVIQTKGLKEMRSGTAPLACLVTMLHSQVRGDRVKNSIFFKLPGRMSLFTLKKNAPQWSKTTAESLMSSELASAATPCSSSNPTADSAVSLVSSTEATEQESCDSTETTAATSGDNDASVDESSSSASCSTEVQPVINPPQTRLSRAAGQQGRSEPIQHTPHAQTRLSRSRQSGRQRKKAVMMPRVVLTPLKVNGEHVPPGPIKRNRGGVDVDFETPGSILVNTNIRALINIRTFSAFPAHSQQQLLQLLPEVDRQVGPDGMARLSSSALNNEFFTHASQSWKERLAEGEFTHEMQVRFRQEMEKEKKVEAWKEKFFEEYHGQKSGLTREESLKLTMSEASEVAVSVLESDVAAVASGTPKTRSMGRRRRDGRMRRRTRADLRRRACRSLCKSAAPAVQPADVAVDTTSLDTSVDSSEAPLPDIPAVQGEVELQAECAVELPAEEPLDEPKSPPAPASETLPAPNPSPVASPIPSPIPSPVPSPIPSSSPIHSPIHSALPSPLPGTSPLPSPIPSVASTSANSESQATVCLLPKEVAPVLASTSSPSSSSSSSSAASSPSCSPSSPSDRQGAFVGGLDSSSSSSGSSSAVVTADPLDDAASVVTSVTGGTATSSRESSPSTSPAPTPAPSSQLKDQKRRTDEAPAFSSFPEKRPRLDDRQSFRITIDGVRSEKPQPTTEEPKVPPIRIQLSRIKPPWVKGHSTYQICPRIVPPGEVSRRSGTGGARTLADIKARAQQARAQREAAAAVAANADGTSCSGLRPSTGIQDSDGRRAREHPGPVEPGGGGGGDDDDGGGDDVDIDDDDDNRRGRRGGARGKGCGWMEETESSSDANSSGTQLQPAAVETGPHPPTSLPATFNPESLKAQPQSPTQKGTNVDVGSGDAQAAPHLGVSSAAHGLKNKEGELEVDPKGSAPISEGQIQVLKPNVGSAQCKELVSEKPILVPTSIPDTVPRFGVLGVDVIHTLATIRLPEEQKKQISSSGVIQHGSHHLEQQETAKFSSSAQQLKEESFSQPPDDAGTQSDSTETASDCENESPGDDQLHHDHDWSPKVRRGSDVVCSAPQNQQPVIQSSRLGQTVIQPAVLSSSPQAAAPPQLQVEPNIVIKVEPGSDCRYAKQSCAEDAVNSFVKPPVTPPSSSSAAAALSKKLVPSGRHVSSVEANNPLVTQLLQGSLPLEKVLPSHSANRLDINPFPGPQPRPPAAARTPGSRNRQTGSTQSPSPEQTESPASCLVEAPAASQVQYQQAAGAVPVITSLQLSSRSAGESNPETTMGSPVPPDRQHPAHRDTLNGPSPSNTDKAEGKPVKTNVWSQQSPSPQQQRLSPACIKSEAGAWSTHQAPIKTSPSRSVPKKEPPNSMDGYLSGGAMEGLINMEMTLARMAKNDHGKASHSVSPSPPSTSVSGLPFQLYGKLPKQGGVSYTANVSVVDNGGFCRSMADGVLQLRPRQTTLSIQAFTDSTAEEVSLKCSCRLKAMIMCQGCGAFCHDDCIGPSKLCVSCLVVR